MVQMKKIALVLRGHFRSFEKCQEYWKVALEKCDYDCFFHTWDTMDANNKSWHRRYKVDSPLLDISSVEILKQWDPNVVIEKQEFTEDEHDEIYASWTPHKSLIYRFDCLLNTLKRIDKDKYEFIIVSRYDLILNNIYFKDIQIAPSVLMLGGRTCNHILGKVAASAELFLFNSSDLDKFYNPLIAANPSKYGNFEEWFNEMYLNIFTEIIHKWHWEQDFNILR